ncbi:MAG: hypothetical protein PHS02_01920 [Candidatus ainarchaeum sp.]|nr:hypothetical protein [Candidatus ainarchaeum sp.]
MSHNLEVLEKRWQGVCRTLFGGEACGLEECGSWLEEFIEPISYHHSSVSGKEVISAPIDYCKGAHWQSLEEVDFGRKFAPLNINEIKDIDSLLGAISDRMYYSGNVVFGKSSNIERSSNLNDSHYIYGVGRHGNSKYIAYSTMGRENEDCFGCNGIEESSFCVKCSRAFRNKRCFEAWMCQNCSDTYYSSGLMGCSECLFSFNMQSRRHCIGNLELEVSKYKMIKEKLKNEMLEKLSKEKKLPSLLGIASAAKAKKLAITAEKKATDDALDKGRIEQAFLETTGIIFGKPLEGGIDRYSKWLTRHTRPTISGHSAASGRELFMPDAANYSRLPKERLLSDSEAHALGASTRMGEKDAEELNLENAHEKIAGLAFFNIEFLEGSNHNNIQCAVCVDSSDNYRNSLMLYVKNSGYNFWPRDSDHIFGCDSPFSSQFSINCYSCTNQVRCFEIDCCGYCSDTYFSHNCENLRDSMFCFNVKNRKNCIGNSELSSADYGRIKKALVEQMHDELSSTKDLKYDIYNIACAGRPG